jgi:hypothetical protein
MCPDEDAMSAYLSQEAGVAPTPTPRDPANPAEREMTEDDEETYEQEKRT